ncbi:Mucin-associated surface protein (MASP) [Trypanosoma cruzi]|uniref:Mucin-associated surface protein (MASP) n=1 Tax=Trypanosoma cruzi TaxID=5693 RepID=A0A2V2WQJ6_TRYCR|nr:Mucin-associated surface protein (MASP) [Trypanosoma cruzi]
MVAMMMTGRVLLVCALCVLWCGAGGVCDEGQEAGTLSPPPGSVHGDQGGVLSGIGRMKPSDIDGQVAVDGGVRDREESKHLSSHVPLVDAKDVTPAGIGGAGNGAVEEVAPEENESLQNSCDEDGEMSEGCVKVQGSDGFPGSGGGHVDRGRQQDDRNPPLPLSDQTSSEEINSPLPAEGKPKNRRPVSRQLPVEEEQTDPVNIRPQEEAATLESEAVRNVASSHSQESAAELANGTLPAHARVTEAEDRSKHIVDPHKDAAEKQKKPVHTTGKSKSTAASGDAHKTTASPAAVDNEAAIKKAKSPGDASSLTSISDNSSNNDTEQNNARDTSEEASHSTENAATHSAGIPRAPNTTAKTDDTATQEDSNSDGSNVKMGEAAPQTAGTAQPNDTATTGESDSSTAVSHTTSPLLLLLLFACAAAAAVVAA